MAADFKPMRRTHSCPVLGMLLKKVIGIVTSYFSQIVTELVTELHHYKSNYLPGKVTIALLF